MCRARICVIGTWFIAQGAKRRLQALKTTPVQPRGALPASASSPAALVPAVPAAQLRQARACPCMA